MALAYKWVQKTWTKRHKNLDDNFDDNLKEEVNRNMITIQPLTQTQSQTIRAF